MALDLIQPVVPDANQNEGAKLGLQGLVGGLAAAARFAEMRRKSESDIAELAMKERISQEAHDLELKKIEAQAPLIDAHKKYYESLIDLNTVKQNAYADGTATAAQRAMRRIEQQQAFMREVSDHASELQLDDPNFAAKEPVKFAANVMQFKDAWQMSPLPDVQQTIRKYQSMADQQKLTLRPMDADGNLAGEAKPQPIWQIVKNLQDPNTKDQTITLLKANGYMAEATKKEPGTPTQSWSRPFDTAWDFLLGPTDKKVTVDTPTPALQKILDKGKGVQFEHVPSRVAPASTKAGAYETLPAPDLPPEQDMSLPDPQTSNSAPKFNPTDTDMIIGHAKAAIAQGAPPAAVAQRLQQDFGIDPSVLFEAEAA